MCSSLSETEEKAAISRSVNTQTVCAYMSMPIWLNRTGWSTSVRPETQVNALWTANADWKQAANAIKDVPYMIQIKSEYSSWMYQSQDVKASENQITARFWSKSLWCTGIGVVPILDVYLQACSIT